MARTGGVDAGGFARAFAGETRQLGVEPAALLGHRGARGVAFLLDRGERVLRAFDGGGQAVGFVHEHENLFFERVFVGFRGGDFVEEGGVFVVGLDGGFVVVELGQPRVDRGDVFLERRRREVWLSAARPWPPRLPPPRPQPSPPVLLGGRGVPRAAGALRPPRCRASAARSARLKPEAQVSLLEIASNFKLKTQNFNLGSGCELLSFIKLPPSRAGARGSGPPRIRTWDQPVMSRQL